MSRKKPNTAEVCGVTLLLPPRSRMGRTMRETLERAYACPGGNSWTVLLNLKGLAAAYTPKYQRAIERVIELNPEHLEMGPFGERGGKGFRWK